MKPAVALPVLMTVGLLAPACHTARESSDAAEAPAAKSVAADKQFVSAGKITLDLDGGSYIIRATADNHIRVILTGNTGNANTELTATARETDARVQVKDTPRNFHATIEVPPAADLVVHFKGGELVLEPIAGSKDVESYGGDITIGIGNPDDYSSVDASVKVGEIDASAFGGSKSGLMPHFTWSGKGKYTLRANLAAGSLALRSK